MTVDLKLAHVSPMPLTADGRTLPFLFIIIFSLSTFSLFPQYLDCLPACLRSFESSILLCFKEVALGINYMLIGTSLTYFLYQLDSIILVSTYFRVLQSLNLLWLILVASTFPPFSSARSFFALPYELLELQRQPSSRLA